MNKIYQSFSIIDKAYLELSPENQRLLENCLMSLSEIVTLSNAKHESTNMALSAISKYTSKKLTESRLPHLNEVATNFTLRQLRNELAHSSLRKRLNPIELRKYENLIWRALEKSASTWRPDELTKFLSYCLQVEIPFRYALVEDPIKIVRIYKALYNAFDEQYKDRAFKELTLRLFSEERFLIALEAISSK